MASRPRSDEIRKTLAALKTNEDVAECLDRTLELIWPPTGVDLAKTPLVARPLLKIDSNNETILDNPDACALLTRGVSQPLPGAQAERSVSGHLNGSIL